MIESLLPQLSTRAGCLFLRDGIIACRFVFGDRNIVQLTENAFRYLAMAWRKLAEAFA